MINIDDLVGVRYLTNGRSKIKGFDCYGLAIEVEKRFGHNLPDLDCIRQSDKDYEKCRQECLKNIFVKEVDSPQKEGDIILISIDCGVINHIGVYLGNNRFIHCNKHGVHIESINVYKPLIRRVYTWL